VIYCYGTNKVNDPLSADTVSFCDCHFSPRSPTWISMGLSLGRRGGRLATDRLSHGSRRTSLCTIQYHCDYATELFVYFSRAAVFRTHYVMTALPVTMYTACYDEVNTL
jgi:hypothetical protein